MIHWLPQFDVQMEIQNNKINSLVFISVAILRTVWGFFQSEKVFVLKDHEFEPEKVLLTPFDSQ